MSIWHAYFVRRKVQKEKEEEGRRIYNRKISLAVFCAWQSRSSFQAHMKRQAAKAMGFMKASLLREGFLQLKKEESE